MESEDYILQQRAADAEYVKAFSEWMASMSSEDKKKMAQKGLDKPEIDKVGNFSPIDAAERAEACCSPEFADDIDKLEDYFLQEWGTLETRQALIAVANFFAWYKKDVERKASSSEICKVAGGLMMKSNAKVEAYGLSFALGQDVLEGKTMQQAGDECSVTKQAISKSARWWIKFLGRVPSQYMKSNAAAKAYSNAQKSNHWRNRKASEINKKNK